VHWLLQQHQQQHLALGQAPEESVAGEQTFRSAFDTFVSSESGGYFLTWSFTSSL
jgi:hypothetical protein